MKIHTRQSRAETAAARWQAQYRGSFVGADKHVITQKLLALTMDGIVTPEAVDAIIGNDYWTSVTCNECNETVDLAVEVGEPFDYYSATAAICVPCLRKALQLAESHEADRKAKNGKP